MLIRSPWTRIDGPAEALVHLGVVDVRAFLRTVARAVASRDMTVRVVAERMSVCVNHGRWLAECACGAWMLASRPWRLAGCLECGAVYSSVEFPDDADDIEAQLMVRPHRENHNWMRSETVEDLRRENVAHGIFAEGTR